MGKATRRCVPIIACVGMLSACVMAELGPHGRQVIHVDGITASGAFDEAYLRCPAGYDVLEVLNRSTPADYTMKIECR